MTDADSAELKQSNSSRKESLRASGGSRCQLISLVVFSLIFVIASIVIFVNAAPKATIIRDIADKLKPSEPPSGGSSYIRGGCGTALHIYIDPDETNNGVEAADNSVATKVSIHEYIHLLQQSFLNGDATETTGPVALRDDATNSDTRFHVIYGCDFDDQETYGALHLAALENMPDDYKLLDVPTYVILYPTSESESQYGCYSMSDAEVTTRAKEIYEEVYGACSGMSDSNMVNANHAFAEGAAEYHGMNMAGVWSTYDGATAWAQKLSDDKGYCDIPSGSNANAFQVQDGSETAIEAVIGAYESLGAQECADNPIGEITYGAWLDYCTSEGLTCTHADLMKVWINTGETGETGWCDSFEEQYGKTWGDFVCYMENAYGVSSDCVAADVPCLGYTARSMSIFNIIGIVLLGLGVLLGVGAGVSVYRTSCKGGGADAAFADVETDAEAAGKATGEVGYELTAVSED